MNLIRVVEWSDKLSLTFNQAGNSLDAIGNLNVTGDINVTGEINCTGTVTGDTDVIGGGISLKNHTHGYIGAGTGSSPQTSDTPL